MWRVRIAVSADLVGQEMVPIVTTGTSVRAIATDVTNTHNASIHRAIIRVIAILDGRETDSTALVSKIKAELCCV